MRTAQAIETTSDALREGTRQEAGKHNEKEVARRRTFGIISHPDAGKTTLTEKLLLYGGAIRQAGSVKARKADRHATSDWMEIEKQRGISVTSSAMQFSFEGYHINILDTPGHQDFSEDTYRVLVAADSAVMLMDASRGVEEQTRKLFRVCRMRGIPIFTFVNKLDRTGADFFRCVDMIKDRLAATVAVLQLPIGGEATFEGVVDLVEMNAKVWRGETKLGETYETIEIPAEYQEKAAEYRAQREVARRRPPLDAGRVDARTFLGDADLDAGRARRQDLPRFLPDQRVAKAVARAVDPAVAWLERRGRRGWEGEVPEGVAALAPRIGKGVAPFQRSRPAHADGDAPLAQAGQKLRVPVVEE